jgi:hypothetical protein
MTSIKHFGLITAAAFLLAFGENAAKAAEERAAVEPTKAALVALETSAYEAWRAKDDKFWNTFLSDNFIGWGSSGRLDKASAAREYTGADCEIKNYVLADEQMSPLGQDAALITHKLAVNGTCAGERNPLSSWAATVYARDGNQWRAAFHAEAAVVDPAAPRARPVAEKATSQANETKPIDRDVHTDALLALERAIWGAWKDHDTKRMDGLTATNIQFINIFGTHFASKAKALKNWSGQGCEVKTVSITDPVATMLSPTVAILTFHASADGTCFGQKVGSVWGTSVYVKVGDVWKWTFGVNLPARREGP